MQQAPTFLEGVLVQRFGLELLAAPDCLPKTWEASDGGGHPKDDPKVGDVARWTLTRHPKYSQNRDEKKRHLGISWDVHFQ